MEEHLGEFKEKNVSLEQSDKNFFYIEQHVAPEIVKKGEGWREVVDGIWACTVCLMCINNLCICINFFS